MDDIKGIRELRQMNLKPVMMTRPLTLVLAAFELYIHNCGLELSLAVIWPQFREFQNDTHFGSARHDAKEDRQDQTRRRQIAKVVVMG